MVYALIRGMSSQFAADQCGPNPAAYLNPNHSRSRWLLKSENLAFAVGNVGYHLGYRSAAAVTLHKVLSVIVTGP